MKDKTKIAVLIPCLAPDDKLICAVREIKKAGFEKILLVNDGSTKEYDALFFQAEELGATVLRHAVNLGKGRALKTGFNFILNEWKECEGLVTADADGQHRPEDLLLCRDALLENEGSLVLGCRNFKKSGIPFRSRFGNGMTSFVMKFLIGLSLSDTQTGLRAFSREQMKAYLTVSGERFEYETNMLLYSKEKNIPVVEVPIETIYLEQNKSSHFRPLQDSIKIYSLFLRYLVASLSSFVVDILLFSGGIWLLKKPFPEFYIVFSTVAARVLSSVYNFFINRKGVFHNEEKIGKTAVRYYLLAGIQMFFSATAVWLLHRLVPVHETVIKTVVDSVLFLISFQLQREWVFRGKK